MTAVGVPDQVCVEVRKAIEKQLETGERRGEFMTYAQIQRSWQQNRSNNGNSPAHQKFPEEMCKKTVINRALKLLINTSTDSSLFEDGEQEEVIKVQDATYTTVHTEISEKANSGPVVTFDEPEAPAANPEPIQAEKKKSVVVQEPATQEAPDF